MAHTQGLESHQVQFYADSTFLAVRVASFLADALEKDGAAAAVARVGHLAAIEHELRLAGVDVDGLERRGVLLLAEAEAMLEQLLVRGMPDEHLFRAHIGTAVAELMANARAPHVHLYGEMVDVLWESGRPQAVFRLEQLWTELIAGRPISLLCGYRMAAFEGSRDGFDTVCAHHASSEEHAVVGAGFATMRAVAELEQRARSLEGEIRLRRRLEQRMHQLLAITGDLAAARTRDQVAQLMIDEGAQALGASTATLWLLAADGGRLEIVAASDPADRSQPPIDIAGDSPLAHAIRTGEAVFLGSREEHEARFPEWRATEVACAILPVVADAAPIGVVRFGYDHVRSFEEPDRAFKAILARQCALAFGRVAREGVLARLYREERDAHLEAEQATRAREEILSVVSHDLRNPLNAIMMGATALLATGSGPRQRSISERIHRQAAGMARLIEDLVDFAGIEAGQLALRRAAHPPDQIIAAVSDLFGPLVEERGLRFAVEVPPGMTAFDCDSDRVVQVLSNLVSNALKVTPRGGTIAVGVRPDRVFYVRDTGPGIAPDELPKLFERYWRSKSSHYKGAGLGLSIARGIVAAHGGTIWAESEPGAGSTFLFSLS